MSAMEKEEEEEMCELRYVDRVERFLCVEDNPPPPVIICRASYLGFMPVGSTGAFTHYLVRPSLVTSFNSQSSAAVDSKGAPQSSGVASSGYDSSASTDAQDISYGSPLVSPDCASPVTSDCGGATGVSVMAYGDGALQLPVDSSLPAASVCDYTVIRDRVQMIADSSDHQALFPLSAHSSMATAQISADAVNSGEGRQTSAILLHHSAQCKEDVERYSTHSDVPTDDEDDIRGEDVEEWSENDEISDDDDEVNVRTDEFYRPTLSAGQTRALSVSNESGGDTGRAESALYVLDVDEAQHVSEQSTDNLTGLYYTPMFVERGEQYLSTEGGQTSAVVFNLPAQSGSSIPHSEKEVLCTHENECQNTDTVTLAEFGDPFSIKQSSYSTFVTASLVPENSESSTDIIGADFSTGVDVGGDVDSDTQSVTSVYMDCRKTVDVDVVSPDQAKMKENIRTVEEGVTVDDVLRNVPGENVDTGAKPLISQRTGMNTNRNTDENSNISEDDKTMFSSKTSLTRYHTTFHSHISHQNGTDTQHGHKPNFNEEDSDEERYISELCIAPGMVRNAETRPSGDDSDMKDKAEKADSCNESLSVTSFVHRKFGATFDVGRPRTVAATEIRLSPYGQWARVSQLSSPCFEHDDLVGDKNRVSQSPTSVGNEMFGDKSSEAAADANQLVVQTEARSDTDADVGSEGGEQTNSQICEKGTRADDNEVQTGALSISSESSEQVTSRFSSLLARPDDQEPGKVCYFSCLLDNDADADADGNRELSCLQIYLDDYTKGRSRTEHRGLFQCEEYAQEEDAVQHRHLCQRDTVSEDINIFEVVSDTEQESDGEVSEQGGVEEQREVKRYNSSVEVLFDYSDTALYLDIEGSTQQTGSTTEDSTSSLQFEYYAHEKGAGGDGEYNLSENEELVETSLMEGESSVDPVMDMDSIESSVDPAIWESSSSHFVDREEEFIDIQQPHRLSHIEFGLSSKSSNTGFTACTIRIDQSYSGQNVVHEMSEDLEILDIEQGSDQTVDVETSVHDDSSVDVIHGMPESEDRITEILPIDPNAENVSDLRSANSTETSTGILFPDQSASCIVNIDPKNPESEYSHDESGHDHVRVELRKDTVTENSETKREDKVKFSEDEEEERNEEEGADLGREDTLLGSGQKETDYTSTEDYDLIGHSTEMRMESMEELDVIGTQTMTREALSSALSLTDGSAVSFPECVQSNEYTDNVQEQRGDEEKEKEDDYEEESEKDGAWDVWLEGEYSSWDVDDEAKEAVHRTGPVEDTKPLDIATGTVRVTSDTDVSATELAASSDEPAWYVEREENFADLVCRSTIQRTAPESEQKVQHMQTDVCVEQTEIEDTYISVEDEEEKRETAAEGQEGDESRKDEYNMNTDISKAEDRDVGDDTECRDDESVAPNENTCSVKQTDMMVTEMFGDSGASTERASSVSEFSRMDTESVTLWHDETGVKCQLVGDSAKEEQDSTKQEQEDVVEVEEIGTKGEEEENDEDEEENEDCLPQGQLSNYATEDMTDTIRETLDRIEVEKGADTTDSTTLDTTSLTLQQIDTYVENENRVKEEDYMEEEEEDEHDTEEEMEEEEEAEKEEKEHEKGERSTEEELSSKAQSSITDVEDTDGKSTETIHSFESTEDTENSEIAGDALPVTTDTETIPSPDENTYVDREEDFIDLFCRPTIQRPRDGVAGSSGSPEQSQYMKTDICVEQIYSEGEDVSNKEIVSEEGESDDNEEEEWDEWEGESKLKSDVLKTEERNDDAGNGDERDVANVEADSVKQTDMLLTQMLGTDDVRVETTSSLPESYSVDTSHALHYGDASEESKDEANDEKEQYPEKPEEDDKEHDSEKENEENEEEHDEEEEESEEEKEDERDVRLEFPTDITGAEDVDDKAIEDVHKTEPVKDTGTVNITTDRTEAVSDADVGTSDTILLSSDEDKRYVDREEDFVDLFNRPTIKVTRDKVSNLSDSHLQEQDTEADTIIGKKDTEEEDICGEDTASEEDEEESDMEQETDSRRKDESDLKTVEKCVDDNVINDDKDSADNDNTTSAQQTDIMVKQILESDDVNTEMIPAVSDSRGLASTSVVLQHDRTEQESEEIGFAAKDEDQDNAAGEEQEEDDEYEEGGNDEEEDEVKEQEEEEEEYDEQKEEESKEENKGPTVIVQTGETNQKDSTSVTLQNNSDNNESKEMEYTEKDEERETWEEYEDESEDEEEQDVEEEENEKEGDEDNGAKQTEVIVTQTLGSDGVTVEAQSTLPESSRLDSTSATLQYDSKDDESKEMEYREKDEERETWEEYEDESEDEEEQDDDEEEQKEGDGDNGAKQTDMIVTQALGSDGVSIEAQSALSDSSRLDSTSVTLQYDNKDDESKEIEYREKDDERETWEEYEDESEDEDEQDDVEEGEKEEEDEQINGAKQTDMMVTETLGSDGTSIEAQSTLHESSRLDSTSVTLQYDSKVGDNENKEMEYRERDEERETWEEYEDESEDEEQDDKEEEKEGDEDNGAKQTDMIVTETLGSDGVSIEAQSTLSESSRLDSTSATLQYDSKGDESKEMEYREKDEERETWEEYEDESEDEEEQDDDEEEQKEGDEDNGAKQTDMIVTETLGSDGVSIEAQSAPSDSSRLDSTSVTLQSDNKDDGSKEIEYRVKDEELEIWEEYEDESENEEQEDEKEEEKEEDDEQINGAKRTDMMVTQTLGSDDVTIDAQSALPESSRLDSTSATLQYDSKVDESKEVEYREKDEERETWEEYEDESEDEEEQDDEEEEEKEKEGGKDNGAKETEMIVTQTLGSDDVSTEAQSAPSDSSRLDSTSVTLQYDSKDDESKEMEYRVKDEERETWEEYEDESEDEEEQDIEEEKENEKGDDKANGAKQTEMIVTQTLGSDDVSIEAQSAPSDSSRLDSTSVTLQYDNKDDESKEIEYREKDEERETWEEYEDESEDEEEQDDEEEEEKEGDEDNGAKQTDMIVTETLGSDDVSIEAQSALSDSSRLDSTSVTLQSDNKDDGSKEIEYRMKDEELEIWEQYEDESEDEGDEQEEDEEEDEEQQQEDDYTEEEAPSIIPTIKHGDEDNIDDTTDTTKKTELAKDTETDESTKPGEVVSVTTHRDDFHEEQMENEDRVTEEEEQEMEEDESDDEGKDDDETETEQRTVEEKEEEENGSSDVQTNTFNVGDTDGKALETVHRTETVKNTGTTDTDGATVGTDDRVTETTVSLDEEVRQVDRIEHFVDIVYKPTITTTIDRKSTPSELRYDVREMQPGMFLEKEEIEENDDRDRNEASDEDELMQRTDDKEWLDDRLKDEKNLEDDVEECKEKVLVDNTDSAKQTDMMLTQVEGGDSASILKMSTVSDSNRVDSASLTLQHDDSVEIKNVETTEEKQQSDEDKQDDGSPDIEEEKDDFKKYEDKVREDKKKEQWGKEEENVESEEDRSSKFQEGTNVEDIDNKTKETNAGDGPLYGGLNKDTEDSDEEEMEYDDEEDDDELPDGDDIVDQNADDEFDISFCPEDEDRPLTSLGFTADMATLDVSSTDDTEEVVSEGGDGTSPRYKESESREDDDAEKQKMEEKDDGKTGTQEGRCGDIIHLKEAKKGEYNTGEDRDDVITEEVPRRVTDEGVKDSDDMTPYAGKDGICHTEVDSTPQDIDKPIESLFTADGGGDGGDSDGEEDDDAEDESNDDEDSRERGTSEKRDRIKDIDAEDLPKNFDGDRDTRVISESYVRGSDDSDARATCDTAALGSCDSIARVADEKTGLVVSVQQGGSDMQTTVSDGGTIKDVGAAFVDRGDVNKTEPSGEPSPSDKDHQVCTGSTQISDAQKEVAGDEHAAQSEETSPSQDDDVDQGVSQKADFKSTEDVEDLLPAMVLQQKIPDSSDESRTNSFTFAQERELEDHHGSALPTEEMVKPVTGTEDDHMDQDVMQKADFKSTEDMEDLLPAMMSVQETELQPENENLKRFLQTVEDVTAKMEQALDSFARISSTISTDLLIRIKENEEIQLEVESIGRDMKMVVELGKLLSISDGEHHQATVIKLSERLDNLQTLADTNNKQILDAKSLYDSTLAAHKKQISAWRSWVEKKKAYYSQTTAGVTEDLSDIQQLLEENRKLQADISTKLQLATDLDAQCDRLCELEPPSEAESMHNQVSDLITSLTAFRLWIIEDEKSLCTAMENSKRQQELVSRVKTADTKNLVEDLGKHKKLVRQLSTIMSKQLTVQKDTASGDMTDTLPALTHDEVNADWLKLQKDLALKVQTLESLLQRRKSGETVDVESSSYGDSSQYADLPSLMSELAVLWQQLQEQSSGKELQQESLLSFQQKMQIIMKVISAKLDALEQNVLSSAPGVPEEHVKIQQNESFQSELKSLMQDITTLSNQAETFMSEYDCQNKNLIPQPITSLEQRQSLLWAEVLRQRKDLDEAKLQWQKFHTDVQVLFHHLRELHIAITLPHVSSGTLESLIIDLHALETDLQECWRQLEALKEREKELCSLHPKTVTPSKLGSLCSIFMDVQKQRVELEARVLQAKLIQRLYQKMLEEYASFLEMAGDKVKIETIFVQDLSQLEQKLAAEKRFFREMEEHKTALDLLASQCDRATQDAYSTRHKDLCNLTHPLADKASVRCDYLGSLVIQWRKLSDELDQLQRVLDQVEEGIIELGTGGASQANIKERPGKVKRMQGQLHDEKRAVFQAVDKGNQILRSVTCPALETRITELADKWDMLNHQLLQELKESETMLKLCETFEKDIKMLKRWMTSARARLGDLTCDAEGNTKDANIRARVEQIQDLCKELQNQLPVKSRVMTTGKQLVTNHSDKVHGVDKQITIIQEDWNELQNSINRTLQHLQQIQLDQLPHQQMLKELKKFLEALEKALKTDAKVPIKACSDVNVQLKKCRIYKMELTNRQQMMEALDDQGYAENVMMLWTKVSTDVDERLQWLQQLSQKWSDFEKAMETLQTRFSQEGKQLQLCRSTGSEMEVKQNLRDCKAVQSQLQVCQKDIDCIQLQGNDIILLSHGSSACQDSVNESLSSLTAQQDQLQQQVTKLEKLLTDVLHQWISYHSVLHNLTQVMAQTEYTLNRHSMVGTDIGALRNQVDRLKQMKSELEHLSTDLDSCSTQASQLSQMCEASVQAEVELAMSDLRSKWRTLTDDCSARLAQFEECLSIWQEYEDKIEKLKKWVDQKEMECNTLVALKKEESSKQEILRKMEVLLQELVEAQINFSSQYHLSENLTRNMGTTTIVSLTARQSALEQKLLLLQQLLSQSIEGLCKDISQISQFKETLVAVEEFLDDVQTFLSVEDPNQHADPSQLQNRLDQAKHLLIQFQVNSGKLDSVNELGYQIVLDADECAHLLLINQKWHKLQAETQELSKMLQSYLSAQQDFSGKCQKWMTIVAGAEEELATDIADNLPDLQIQQRKRQRFETEMFSCQQVLYAVISDGQKIIQAGLVEDPGQFEKKLQLLLDQWQSIIQRSRQQQSIIDRTVQDWLMFNAKSEQLSLWLEEKKAEVKLFESDKISPHKIKSLLDRLGTIQSEFTLQKENYDRIQELGTSLQPADTDAAEKISQTLAQLQQVWTEVHSQVEQHYNRLDGLYIDWQSLETEIEEILKWLKDIQQSLLADIPDMYDDLQTALTQCQATADCLHGSESRREGLVTQEKKLSSMIGAEDTVVLQQRIQLLNKLWDELLTQTQLREQQLTHAISQWSSLMNQIGDMTSWIEDMQCQLDSGSDVHVEQLVKKLKLDDDRESLSSKGKEMDDMKTRGQQLMKLSSGDRASDIEQQLQKLQDKWDHLQAVVDARIKHTKQLCEQFRGDVEAFSVWLSKMETEVAELRQELPAAVTKDDSYRYEAVAEKIQTRLKDLESINSQFHRLTKEGRIDSQGMMHEKVQMMNGHWDALQHQLTDLMQSLQQSSKAHEDFMFMQQSVMQWLKEMDSQLTVIDHLSQQDVHDSINTLQRIREELDSQEDRVNVVKDRVEILVQQMSSEGALKIRQAAQDVIDVHKQVLHHVDVCHRHLNKIMAEKSSESTERLVAQIPSVPTDDSYQLHHARTGIATLPEATVTPIQQLQSHESAPADSDLADSDAVDGNQQMQPSGKILALLDQLSEAVSAATSVLERTEIQIKSRDSGDIAQNHTQNLMECKNKVDAVQELHQLLTNEAGNAAFPAEDAQVTGVVERWMRLKSCAEELKIPLSEQHRAISELSSDMDNFIKWTVEAEALLASHDTIPSDLTQLNIVIRQHEDFMAQLKDKELRLLSIQHLSLKYIDKSTQEGCLLQSRMLELENRWRMVNARATDIKQSLQRALLECQDFHHSVDDYLLWLEAMETRIQQNEPVSLNDETSMLRMKYTEFKDLYQELEGKQPEIMKLQETVHQLLGDSDSADVSVARDKTLDISNKLQSLLVRTASHIQLLESRLKVKRPDIASREGQLPPLLFKEPGIVPPADETDSARLPTDSEAVVANLPPGLAHQPRSSLLYRVLRTALPLQLLLLFLLGFACLIPICEDEESCFSANNLRFSLSPMLRYTDGAPPT